MKLELYHRKECPFSAKVRDFISTHGLKSQIEYHDIDEDDASLDRLMQMNDDEQVPCLVMDGKPMLESDEIIAWLDHSLVKQKTKANQKASLPNDQHLS